MHDDVRSELERYIEKMPPLPTSIAKVMDVCNNPESSPADLSRVISLDPVLMGKVMKLINSAYYGLSNRVKSLTRAVIMLGINTVKNLALSTAVLGSVGSKTGQGIDVEGFWVHSLSVGVTAKLIAKKRGEPARELEEYFIAGLLHDIGKVPFINRFSSVYKETINYADEKSYPLFAGKTDFLGCNHAEAGQMIAKVWNLDENLSHCISCHHEPYKGPHRNLVYTIAAANYYINRKGIGYSGDMHPEELEEGVFDYLGVSFADLDGMEEEIKAAIDKAKVFLELEK